jgi:hypothetical protein
MRVITATLAAVIIAVVTFAIVAAVVTLIAFTDGVDDGPTWTPRVSTPTRT